ncbi:DNA polymerase III subunit delta [Methyloligella sp. 2.7D]|uniref:DNA polymerase III subunit delta n=1 Tax=unclassified Methyloligella TaxID=2625955 RepID=UPI00157DE76F|nr:DNA polymerase III subunit delta [Methyloligella sp. GL2]QKP76264.1 DNA polymerase III subunit delta [Methyloligella sp. GL2]
MVAYKSNDVPRFLKQPDSACRAVLVYGPDTGLVSERAGAMQRYFLKGAPDGETVRLDERDFAENSGVLEIELRTKSMFASANVVRVTANPRLDAVALKTTLAEPPENPLIVEAGNLKPDSALRKLFEKLPFAAALPCYADERNLASLIDEELSAAGLGIDRETRDYLTARLGADQALSRAELSKLTLYAAGKETVTVEDVDAVVGDSAEVAVENFVFLVSGGQTQEAIRQLGRLDAAGISAQAVLSSLTRHFMRMHMIASAAAKNDSAETALRRLRPPLHFKRRGPFLKDCQRWGAGRLLAALPRIQEATLRARLAPDLAQAHAERLVLALRSRA